MGTNGAMIVGGDDSFEIQSNHRSTEQQQHHQQQEQQQQREAPKETAMAGSIVVSNENQEGMSSSSLLDFQSDSRKRIYTILKDSKQQQVQKTQELSSMEHPTVDLDSSNNISTSFRVIDQDDEDDEDDDDEDFSNVQEEVDGGDSGGGNDRTSKHNETENESVSSKKDKISKKRHQQKRKNQDDFQVAQKEDLAVRRLKLLFILVLVVTAGIACSLLFKFLQNQENEEFEIQFNHLATQVVDKLHLNIRTKMEAISSLALQVQAYAINTEKEWPFVTMPYFEQHVASVKSLTGAYGVQFFPIVTDEKRARWENYTIQNNGWINASYEAQLSMYNTTNNRPVFNKTWFNSLWGEHYTEDIPNINRPDFEKANGMSDQIFSTSHTGIYNESLDPYVYPTSSGPYYPQWQTAPISFYYQATINLNYHLFEDFAQCAKISQTLGEACLGEAWNDGDSPGYITTLLYPISDAFNMDPVSTTTATGVSNGDVVAFLGVDIYWESYLGQILSPSAKAIYVEVNSTCDTFFTIKIIGGEAIPLAENKTRDYKFKSALKVSTRFGEELVREPNATNGIMKSYIGSPLHNGYCQYDFTIYPSVELEEQYVTNQPMLATITVAVIFGFVIMLFILYDCLVERRQKLVMRSAIVSDSIVSSIFPGNVKQRLYTEREEEDASPASDDNMNIKIIRARRPIANLFAETTVMFADIAGFTAWSSGRQPGEVFILLETLYHGFDEIAKKRRIFKVETVGDCYVAVAGCPQPRSDHAVAMCRFAKHILYKMRALTQKLQQSLGPGTEDLALRIGVHSGPVTAGVLRGQNSRFQLFGDTVNTAARMEQNGLREKIHVSKDTAELLVAAGKMEWLIQRHDKIVAKGKGELQTYWLDLESCVANRHATIHGGRPTDHDTEPTEHDLMASEIDLMDSKTSRLIDWNCDTLVGLLEQIKAARLKASTRDNNSMTLPNEERYNHIDTIPFEEVSDVITFPVHEKKIGSTQDGLTHSELDADVMDQVYSYVRIIAATYNNNAFHSFEHASHVTLSVTKLLSIIATPMNVEGNKAEDRALNEYSASDSSNNQMYGIVTDPLTQFACVFASLIHAVGHPGVPNSQLVKEKIPTLSIYKDKSITEQHSLDIAWRLLMQDKYNELRRAIYTTDEEFIYFRQLVVNCVMATDIDDEELQTLRSIRWDRAFVPSKQRSESDATNRKATIMIEHIMQASVISHAMQHWDNFTTWNENLFLEHYKAFCEGRTENDPGTVWYEMEMKSFDSHVIPLANKLKACGMLGDSTSEYLDFSVRNRNEWETMGSEIVHQLIEKTNQLSNKSNCR